MNTIFNKVCVLVTAAFAFALVPRFRKPERFLPSRRDQGTALLVFLVLGLVEEATVSQPGLLNERIVTVCAPGLVACPWVGLAVRVFVTWLVVAHHGLPLGSLAISMSRSLKVLVPPFSFQPLVENAVQQGLYSKRFGADLLSPGAITSNLRDLTPQ
jgi:LytS/YehU family sensor histidine kinase